MELKDYCNGTYSIICICEGTAEEDVMNWLLDEDRLILKRKDLVGKNRYQLTRTRKVRKIENEMLNLDFEKPVVIFRIIDSRSEKFVLSNLYKHRFDVVSFRTNPEIEILMISFKGDLHRFMTKHSREKPSVYATKKYKLKHIKQKGMMKSFFDGNINSLIASLKTHKSKIGRNHLTIYDLIQ